MTHPLLSLVMIVKNEARSIEATIASVKPHVDRYTIVDTGSTDDTRERISSAFAGTPGELHQAPFVDFSTTRNLALDRAGDASVFTLMLSGDETLHDGDALRAFCEQKRDAPDGAYHVRVHFGALRYDSPRLARASAGWRYEGVTHEVLRKPDEPPPRERVPGAHIHHDLTHRDPDAQRRRWRIDLRLLSDEHKRRPDDLRTLFYLAQTLECLGDHRSALGAYERRAAAGGWREEAYEALFRVGRVKQALKLPWPEVQQAYLDAHAHSPHRAEPLYQVAWYYFQRKNWPLTFLFASRAAQIPLPSAASLFVDADVYTHKTFDLLGTAAYYVGEFDAGETAVRRALAVHPDDPRLLKNLSFYTDRKR